MQRTQKLRPVTVADPGWASAPFFVASALLAMGVAYLMLLGQPGLVQGLSGVWSRIPGAAGSPVWALPAVAAGVAVGGAAVGIALLSAFVRGVQAHPYAWLAPVLIGFSTLVMCGMSIALPWPSLSLRTFSLFSGLTVLGAGAVLQMRGTAAKAAGGLLLLLPFMTLLAGYAAMPTGIAGMLAKLDASGQLYLFVLGLTSLGVGFMALVTHRADADAHLVARGMGEPRMVVAEAHERARISEERAAELERRLQLAEHQLRVGHANGWAGAAISDAEAAEFAALARPGMSRGVVIGATLCAAAALVAGIYFVMYQPLAKRTAAQQAIVADRAKEHAAEIDGLRKHFQAQQASLQSQLAAEQQKAAQALAAVEQARAASAGAAPAQTAAAAAEEAEKAQVAQREAAEKPAAKVSSRSARRTAAHKAAPAKLEPPKAQAAAASADTEPQLDRATRKALRESIDDDPIGGLEGM